MSVRGTSSEPTRFVASVRPSPDPRGSRRHGRHRGVPGASTSRTTRSAGGSPRRLELGGSRTRPSTAVRHVLIDRHPSGAYPGRLRRPLGEGPLLNPYTDGATKSLARCKETADSPSRPFRPFRPDGEEPRRRVTGHHLVDISNAPLTESLEPIHLLPLLPRLAAARLS